MTPHVFTEAQLVVLLSPTLGRERARELVGSTARSLGLSPDRLDAMDADRILSAISTHGGLVGVAARVARQRLPKPSPAGPVSTPASSEQVGVSRAQPDVSVQDLVDLLSPTLGPDKSSSVVTNPA